MPTAASNGIEICYESFGDPDDPTLLLVAGLGAQLLAWPEPFCEGLVDRGFHVVRFDNRDVGLSTWFDEHPADLAEVMPRLLAGEVPEVPYHLTDMAADAAGLLDALGVERAHVVGASMGGMIAQTFAIEHRERAASLTSMWSTTGDPDVGQAQPEVLQAMLRPTPEDRDAAIEQGIELFTAIGSPDHMDQDLVHRRVADSYDRASHPQGQVRQLLATVVAPSRTEALAEVDVPSLVIHGALDPLIDVSGGRRTAEALPDSELLVIDEMGHDLPPPFWAQVIEAITRTAVRAATTEGAA